MFKIENDPKTGMNVRIYGNRQLLVYNAEILEQEGVKGVAFDFHGTLTCDEKKERITLVMQEVVRRTSEKHHVCILSSSRRKTVINSGIDKLLPGVDIQSTQNKKYIQKARRIVEQNKVNRFYAAIVKIPEVVGCNVLIDDALIVTENQEPVKLNFCGIKPINISCIGSEVLEEALTDLGII